MNTNYNQKLQHNELKKIKTILNISLVVTIICLLKEVYVYISDSIQLNVGISFDVYFYTIIQYLFFYTVIILMISSLNKLVSMRISEIHNSTNMQITLPMNNNHKEIKKLQTLDSLSRISILSFILMFSRFLYKTSWMVDYIQIAKKNLDTIRRLIYLIIDAFSIHASILLINIAIILYIKSIKKSIENKSRLLNTNYNQKLQQNYLKKIKTTLSISLVITIISLLSELYIDMSSYVQSDLDITFDYFFFVITDALFFYTAIILIILCINKLISIKISEIYASIDILNLNKDHEIN